PNRLLSLLILRNGCAHAHAHRPIKVNTDRACFIPPLAGLFRATPLAAGHKSISAFFMARRCRARGPMPASPTPEHAEIRSAIARLSAGFPGEYWRRLDAERAYPTEFVQALTKAGSLACLIPADYGGSGLGLAAAAAILEEIHKSGGNGAACHAQMYI